MTEQEVRTLLTDALVNLFEIEPEPHQTRNQPLRRFGNRQHRRHRPHRPLKRETGRKLQAEDFRNVRTVDDVVQAVLKVQAQDS